MRYKFNIGAIVYYRPKGRMLDTARGTYTVTCLPAATSSLSIESSISAKTSSASRWKTSCRRVILNMVSDDDDPRAPYKVYEGGELKGTYATRAEARRAQQRLAESEPDRHFIIKGLLDRVVI